MWDYIINIHLSELLRLRLVCVKVFPENRCFPEMLFSGKENVFMCLVAFQKMFRKIFSDVWLCSWKYHRKHIFYLLLTFSHIFSITKRKHNIIHSSEHKQNPEKIIKSEQMKARSRLVRLRSRSRRSRSHRENMLSFWVLFEFLGMNDIMCLFGSWENVSNK